MTDDDLEHRIGRAIAARRPPPARDLETRLAAAAQRPSGTWLVPALASLVAVVALVVIVWRVPSRERVRAPEPSVLPAPSQPPQPAAVPPAVEMGELSITCDPPARVTIDGRAVGTTPVDLRIAAGEHDLVLTAEGRALYKRLAIVANERTKLVLKIQ